jgi:hypothetical protein
MRMILVLAVLLACGCDRTMLVGRTEGGSSATDGGGVGTTDSGGGGGGAGVGGYADETSHQIFVESANTKIDLLFMIDNSNSMEPKQASLMQFFPNLIQPIKDLPIKPDLHIGIVTSDMGAGQFTPPSCDTLGGDQGILQNTPLGATCATAHLNNAADRFLSYAQDSWGGPVVNFTGDIADAFACYAAVGTGGCGFEHQLASVKAALDECQSDAGCRQRQNVGFLRDDAYLVVVILTDEDDCSAPSNSPLFDPTQTTLTSQLGPLTSYRCFEFGNLCGGVDPGRRQGPRENCEPGNKDADTGHQLIPTQDLAVFLKALKPWNPGLVYVTVIAGPAGPVEIGLDANGYPDMQPACTGGMGTADPGLRLAQFVSWFSGRHGVFASVCDADLSGPLSDLGSRLGQVSGRHCLNALPADSDLETSALDPACVVMERTLVDASSGTYTHQLIPRCTEVLCYDAQAPGEDCACQMHSGASQVNPCWYVWRNTTACAAPQPSFDGAAYELKVDRGTDAACNTGAPAPNTQLILSCASCQADPASNRYDCSPGCARYWPGCCPTPTPGCAG